MKVLKYLRRITLVTLLLLAGQLAWAQADNTPENSTLGEGKGNISAQSKSAEGIFRADNYGYNAIAHTHQNRFRYPDKIEYSNKNFLSHFYFGYTVSADNFTPRTNLKYDWGLSHGLLIGKEIDKYHSLELILQYGSNVIHENNYKTKRFGAEADYHFNFTRYYLGYNPFRKIELKSTVGLGFQNTDLNGYSQTSPYLLFGAQIDYRLGSRAWLSFAPHIAFGTSGLAGFDSENWYSGHDVMYGGRVSLAYELQNELTEDPAYKETFLQPRNYIFVGTGIHMTNARKVDVINTLGPEVNIGYGHWLTNKLALQFTLGYANSNTSEIKTPATSKTPAYTRYTKTQYAYARAEAVINAFTTLKDNEFDNNFSINLLGGYQIGKQWICNSSYKEQEETIFGNVTAGMQFKYHMTEGKSLYLEPRVSLGSYNDGDFKKKDYYEDTKYYTDWHFSLTAGMEFGNENYGRVIDPEKPKDKFRQQASFLASFGPNYMFIRDFYKNGLSINTSYSIGAEYQPFSMFGIRGTLNYSKYNFNYLYSYKENVDGKTTERKALWNKSYGIISAILDVKLDLSNMIYGYRADRKWNTAFYVGPMLSKIVEADAEISDDEFIENNAGRMGKKKDNKTHIGLHAALNARYNITQRLGIFTELGAKIYKNDLMHEPQLDINPIRALSLEFGLNYNLIDPLAVPQEGETPSLKPRHYTFIGTGINMNSASNVGFGKSLGPVMNFGYGYWLNNNFAAQLTLGYSNTNNNVYRSAANSKQPAYTRYAKMQNFFVRTEGVLNIFSTLKQNDFRNKFSIDLLGGYEFGKYWDTKDKYINQEEGTYADMTGAVRLKYHTIEGKSLYIEPRVTMKNVNKGTSAVKDYLTGANFSLTAGMEFGTENYAVHAARHNDTFTPQTTVMVAAGTNYLFIRNFYENKNKINSSFSAGIEYQPFSMFGIRGMLGYNKYNFDYLYSFNDKIDGKSIKRTALLHKGHSFVSGILDLKLDLSNMLYGYRADRKWNTAFYIGPSLSMLIDSDAEMSDDEFIESDGVRLGTKKDGKAHWGLHAALSTRYNVTENWGIFAETGLNIYKNELLTEAQIDYNPVRSLSLQFGVSHTLKNAERSNGEGRKPIQPKNYTFAGIGMAFGTANSIGLGDSRGTTFNFGYGYWLNKSFALQLTGGYTNGNNFKAVQGGTGYTRYTKMQSVLGRAEAVVNLFSTLKEGDFNNKFSVNLLGGYEFGKVWDFRGSLEDQFDYTYGNITGAMRLKYHVNEGKSIYIEPRATLAMNDRGTKGIKDYQTGLNYSITAGVEFGNENFAKQKGKSSDKFEKQLDITASYGNEYVMIRDYYKNDNGMNHSLSLGIEYQHIAPVGLRLKLNYTKYNFDYIYSFWEYSGKSIKEGRGLGYRDYAHLSTILDVKFDLTNIFAGYRRDRKWNTALYLGPSFTRKLSCDAKINSNELKQPDNGYRFKLADGKKSTIGFHAALNCSYNVTKNIGVFGEIGTKLYKDEFLTEPQLDFSPIKTMSLELGVKYRIK